MYINLYPCQRVANPWQPNWKQNEVLGLALKQILYKHTKNLRPQKTELDSWLAHCPPGKWVGTLKLGHTDSVWLLLQYSLFIKCDDGGTVH